MTFLVMMFVHFYGNVDERLYTNLFVSLMASDDACEVKITAYCKPQTLLMLWLQNCHRRMSK